ncbi:MAG: hypothetical protein ACPL88_03245 [Bryobacteraceae bacterium]
MRHGAAARDSVLHAVPYSQSWELAGARLTALPSAHILGAAQLLVEWRGSRILYTGDIKMRLPLCGRATETVCADRLIVESTFGLPVFHFLDREEARQRIVDFARSCLAEKRVPVFLAHELGRGQELVHVLCQAGVPVLAHPLIAQFLPIYAAAGFAAPGWALFEGELHGGAALVIPPCLRSSPPARGPRKRLAYVSGWAALDNARARTGAEELIPYPDHADFSELLALVEATGTSEVDVVHGYSEAFARILTLRGILARAPERSRAPEENG